MLMFEMHDLVRVRVGTVCPQTIYKVRRSRRKLFSFFFDAFECNLLELLKTVAEKYILALKLF